MKAKRIDGFADIDTDEICYYKAGDIWMFYHPVCGLGSLEEHEVEEHEDGSISVSPSILIDGKDSIHGYLKQGVWRDC